MQRAYLYYDVNLEDRQYFWAPRIDKVDGSEPSILDLLHVKENSTLIFSYDIAGNQNQRFYCEEEGFCGPSAPTSRIAFGSSSSMQQAEEDIVEITDEPIEEEDTIDTSYHIYPNPTNGQSPFNSLDLGLSWPTHRTLRCQWFSDSKNPNSTADKSNADWHELSPLWDLFCSYALYQWYHCHRKNQ